MKKYTRFLFALVLLSVLLSGCSAIGDKSESVAVIYDVTAVASFLLLAGYCFLIRRKDIWFLLLFSSVFVVNAGYLTLALSRSLDEALLANRVAYLGSVCLPLSMLMIIRNVCGAPRRKWLPGLLTAVGAVVFLIAASPGYLDIYYKEVTLATAGGVTVLDKVYGPWHSVYLFYLVGYFAAMLAVMIPAAARGRLRSPIHVVILAIAVCVNMGVWLLEQLVKIDFELLSVSYIISELFLLCLCLLMQENAPAAKPVQEAPSTPLQDPDAPAAKPAGYEDRCAYLASQLPRLTPTERAVYDLYLSGAGTKEILAALGIKENTLKYHNKNIYGKLGVSSRKELVEIAEKLNQ